MRRLRREHVTVGADATETTKRKSSSGSERSVYRVVNNSPGTKRIPDPLETLQKSQTALCVDLTIRSSGPREGKDL